MAQAKRHHWWPIAQSKHWVDSGGCVHVTRADGSVFRANPVNIGVESELYTRFLDDDTKDTTIEDWFANTIDGSITKVIGHLSNPRNVTRRPFCPAPEKAAIAKAAGFRVNPYIDSMSMPQDVREAIAAYIAALLVRHPLYLAKLAAFGASSTISPRVAKQVALDKMPSLFDVYRAKILTSVLLLTKRAGTAEYLYSDGGLAVDEPWRKEFGIPFDMHAPLTPDWALQVLPVPSALAPDLSTAFVAESTNQGVARQNRIILGGAKRFVFSRQQVPTSFVLKSFGKPAPRDIWYRIGLGGLEAGLRGDRK